MARGQKERQGKKMRRRAKWAPVLRELVRYDGKTFPDLMEVVYTAMGKTRLSGAEKNQVRDYINGLIEPVPGGKSGFRIVPNQLKAELTALLVEEASKLKKAEAAAKPAPDLPPATGAASMKTEASSDIQTVTPTRILCISIKEAEELLRVCPNDVLPEEFPIGTPTRFGLALSSLFKADGLVISTGWARGSQFHPDWDKFDLITFYVNPKRKFKERRWADIPLEEQNPRPKGAWLTDLRWQLDLLGGKTMAPIQVSAEPKPSAPPPAPVEPPQSLAPMAPSAAKAEPVTSARPPPPKAETALALLKELLAIRRRTLDVVEEEARPYIDRHAKALADVREAEMAIAELT